jgi:hypothetical protein
MDPRPLIHGLAMGERCAEQHLKKRGGSEMEVTAIGIDLAKSVFAHTWLVSRPAASPLFTPDCGPQRRKELDSVRLKLSARLKTVLGLRNIGH